MKRLLMMVLCFSIVTAFSEAALAQSVSISNCVNRAGGVQWDAFGHLPVGVFDCVDPPLFLFIGDTCSGMGRCPAAAGPIEAKKDCPYCTNPISLATGNTYIEQTDLRVPGLSYGLTLSRRWNSQWPSTQMAFQTGLFGPNWRSTYEERVFMGDDHYIKYARGDGSFWSFGGGGAYIVVPANVAGTLTVDGPRTQWTLTFQNGEQRIFNYTSGSLTSIIDRNGNTTTLSYDGLNRLVSVTDPAGRHLYFGYPNGTSRLVNSVTSDIGLSLSYAYDGQGRLIQVTKPDQTTLNFQYDSNSMITAVTDSNGKVLESHTYDSSHRGLTSSRAGGVEAVTISYQ